VQPHEVEVETVSVRERTLEIMSVLERHASIDFEMLMNERFGRTESRALFVATFLGILELTRMAILRIYQGLDDLGVPEGPIHLRRAIDPSEQAWADQIASVS
jgi:chromatin segregation and condensation protein Rec8/ScpA/Scc1 (kleisin family)